MSELICPRNSKDKKTIIIEVKNRTEEEAKNTIRKLKNSMKKIDVKEEIS